MLHSSQQFGQWESSGAPGIAALPRSPVPTSTSSTLIGSQRTFATSRRPGVPAHRPDGIAARAGVFPNPFTRSRSALIAVLLTLAVLPILAVRLFAAVPLAHRILPAPAPPPGATTASNRSRTGSTVPAAWPPRHPYTGGSITTSPARSDTGTAGLRVVTKTPLPVNSDYTWAGRAIM
jgi:hypothetical protein